MAGERTEKPTGRRLSEARRRGQIARSRDLGMAISTLAVTGTLGALGAYIVDHLQADITHGIVRLARSPLKDVNAEELSGLVFSGLGDLVLIVGPLAGIAACAAVLASFAQGGFNLATEALQINWGRLSPATGFAKLKPSRSGIDTLKTIVIATVLAILAWQLCSGLAQESATYAWASPADAAARGWTRYARLLWQAGFALLAFGGADYGLQWWRVRSSLKMTKQEVKDDARMTEGSPEVKMRVRRIQREMARRRMLKATKKATVVITNPTHFAVALEYRREKNPAPVVVAKGQDLIAQKIRQIARESEVPIVENPPLARALFKTAEIGDMIPPDLFGAVAEVLAYLIRIKQLMV
jgi:flagellar biosynthetic protein FlhB